MTWQDRTKNVLSAVLAERERQVDQYGHNHDLADGTGPEVEWVPYSIETANDVVRADEAEALFRQDYLDFEVEHGKPTWMHLVREEVAEAFQEDDPDRLAEELIQIAALCVSWVETIEERLGVPVRKTQPIESLGLPVRARNALLRNGIETVDDLCVLTIGELLDIRNIGSHSFDAIGAALQAQGRTLRDGWPR